MSIPGPSGKTCWPGRATNAVVFPAQCRTGDGPLVGRHEQALGRFHSEVLRRPSVDLGVRLVKTDGLDAQMSPDDSLRPHRSPQYRTV